MWGLCTDVNDGAEAHDIHTQTALWAASRRSERLPAKSSRGGPRGTTHIHSSVLHQEIATCTSRAGGATHVGSSTIELRLKIRDRSAIRPLPTLPRYGWTMRGRNVNNSRDQGRDLPETYWSRLRPWRQRRRLTHQVRRRRRRGQQHEVCSLRRPSPHSALRGPRVRVGTIKAAWRKGLCMTRLSQMAAKRDPRVKELAAV